MNADNKEIFREPFPLVGNKYFIVIPKQNIYIRMVSYVGSSTLAIVIANQFWNIISNQNFFWFIFILFLYHLYHYMSLQRISASDEIRFQYEMRAAPPIWFLILRVSFLINSSLLFLIPLMDL